MMALVAAGLQMTATVTPASSSRAASFGGSCPSVTANVVNPPGVVAYSWAVLVADPVYALTINTPLAASTSFNFAPPGPGNEASAIVRVTATSGAASSFADVPVSFVNNAP